MKFFVIVLLVTVTSGDDPFVYETPYTGSHHHNTGSQTPLMIISPQQSQSFRPVQSQSGQFRSSFSAQQFQPASRPFVRTQQAFSFPSGSQRFIPSQSFQQPQHQFQHFPTLPAPRPFQPAPISPAPLLQHHQTSPLLSLCDPINKPLIDDTRNGLSYHFSWCHDGNQEYPWEEANHYCTRLGLGFQAVSIKDQGKDSFITNIIERHSLPWIWTSGNKLNTQYWVWSDGSSVVYNNWSHTGGSGMPQPDNRENNNEKCLGVLNNFYQDGIKWHDIGCHHLKPVICETSYSL